MDCQTAREAISAVLDGEPAGVPRKHLDDHLDACTDCRWWQERAHEVTRRVRVVAAQSTPIATAPSGRTSSEHARLGWRSPEGLARIGLVMVALAQLVWVTVPALLLGEDRSAPIHVAHEMGSFDIALAVGFLVAAWRPQRAQGLRALVGTVAAALVITAIVDLLSAHTTFADEAPHLLAVAGWLLLRRLATLDPARGHARLAVPAWPAWLRPHSGAARIGSRARPASHLEGFDRLTAERARGRAAEQAVCQEASRARAAAR